MSYTAYDVRSVLNTRTDLFKTRDDFWPTVVREWPRRLLYVPAMKSVTRGENDSFSNPDTLQLDIRPRYNILSYTWGRWRSEEYPAIAIQGTNWRIPAVIPEHFTASDFERVLRYVAAQGGVKYVWVDVACINRGRNNPEDIAEGADQVGKQMSIFSQASTAYIWLCGTSGAELEKTLDAGLDAHLKLNSELAGFGNLGGRIWSEPARTQPRDLPSYKEQTVLDCIESIQNAMSRLLLDKWFSSLWTLQESVLSRDAVLLTHEGTPILAAADQQTLVTLAITANPYRILLRDLDRYLVWVTSARITNKIVDLERRIRQTMLVFMTCTNPNVPYSLARYRECKEEEDRIYGVMQTYGFRLGKSVQPHLNFTLDELNLQFVKTLSEQYPVISQMFVHTVIPEYGGSWRITPDCEIPEDLTVYDLRPPHDTNAPWITAEELARGDAGVSFPSLDIQFWDQLELHSFGKPVSSCATRWNEIVPNNTCEIKTSIDVDNNSHINGYGWYIAEMKEILLKNAGRLHLDATQNQLINSAQAMKFDGGISQELWRTEEFYQELLSNQLNVIGADTYLVYLGHVWSLFDPEALRAGKDWGCVLGKGLAGFGLVGIAFKPHYYRVCVQDEGAG